MPTDWYWNNYTFNVYIVPDSLSQLFGVNCQFHWDAAKLSVLSVERGNIWDAGFFFDLQSGNSWQINASIHGVTDYTIWDVEVTKTAKPRTSIDHLLQTQSRLAPPPPGFNLKK